jgi:hypothetical protein
MSAQSVSAEVDAVDAADVKSSIADDCNMIRQKASKLRIIYMRPNKPDPSVLPSLCSGTAVCGISRLALILLGSIMTRLAPGALCHVPSPYITTKRIFYPKNSAGLFEFGGLLLGWLAT